MKTSGGGRSSSSLVSVLTWRLVMTTICVMLLQAGIVAVRDYINETDFLNNYVRREALRLARALPERSLKAVPVTLHPIPPQYTGATQAAYAFRIVEVQRLIEQG